MQEKPTILDKLNKVITIAGNIILMNLMFLVASIPLVTMGQAWCGLLTAVRYQIRGDKWTAGFKKGFTTRFWRGTIMWVIMAVVDAYFMIDMFEIVNQIGLDIPSVMAALVFGLMIMVTFSLQILNVYVPTPVGQWLRNGVNMVFKAPMELLAAAALFWVPFAMLYQWTGWFIYAVMIFVAAYFALAAAAGTLVLKNALMFYLLEARVTNTLLEDDSNAAKQSDEE